MISVQIIKFIHVLLALSIVGLTIYGVISFSSKPQNNFLFFNKKLLIISVFVMLTGSLLVYPKHFSMHAPWIRAAYFLTIMYALGLLICIKLANKIKRAWVWRCLYLIFISILFFIIHDAVTKNTFLSFI